MKTITYEVDFPGEEGAGLRAYSDTISITVDSGDFGGDVGEFQKEIRDFLVEWYDEASVVETKPADLTRKGEVCCEVCASVEHHHLICTRCGYTT